MSHTWYKYLDKWFPGKGRSVVLRKVAVDTAIAGPAFIGLYFYGMALAEKKGFRGSWQALVDVFIPVFTANVCYWPLAQAVNFYAVPSHYRVLVISICALFWNIFLSFVQHLENDSEKDPLHLSIEQHHVHEDNLTHSNCGKRLVLQEETSEEITLGTIKHRQEPPLVQMDEIS